MIICVCPEYLVWPLFSVIGESCLHLSPRFLVYSVSLVSFVGTGPVMSRQPSSLTPDMPSPTSLGAKPCFHAFDCIFFFLNALFLFSTFLTLIFLILVPPTPTPWAPCNLYLKFLDFSHSYSLSFF